MKPRTIAILSPLWVPGVLLGLAIGEGIRQVLAGVVKDWRGAREIERAVGEARDGA